VELVEAEEVVAMRRTDFKLSRWVLPITALSMSAILLGVAPHYNFSQFGTSLKNWGLTNTVERSHINALDAWTIEEGSRNIIVAVIDTGIDPNHKDLSVNIWKRKPTSEFGWNFVSNQPNPMDDHGHGTHVAGIIGALADPKSGVSGVAHRVSIMSVKYYSNGNSGDVNLHNTIMAINYAVDNGAKVINYSGGGRAFSDLENQAIKRAQDRGVLFVAAAGNETRNTDHASNYYYPAAYRLPNIISVAATDIHNKLLPTSNWGRKTVDVAAPGENIYSTMPGNRYGYMTGTSQATAFVSGVAALLLSQNPTLKAEELKRIIMASVDQIPGLIDKTSAGGRVNAYRALLILKNNKAPNIKLDLLAQRPSSMLQVISDPE
jgi:subtilisin family serine protease